MYPIVSTTNTVNEFKAEIRKMYGNKPFTRKEAAAVCQTPSRTNIYGHGKTDDYYTDSKGNRLALGTILSYIDIHHKEQVEGGTRYELFGLRVPVSKYEQFPAELKAMCKSETWDSAFVRNYYTIDTTNRLNSAIAKNRRRTEDTILNKRKKIAALQREISQYEAILSM